MAAGSSLSYAWSGTGTFTNGTTSSPSVTGIATGNYTVTVSNVCGTVTSTAAVVAKTLPSITGTTTNSPVCPNGAINLNVTATGTAPLSYSWFGIGNFSNSNIANPTVTYGIDGDYTVTVSNSCGSVVGTATATFYTPPIIYSVTGTNGGVYCTGGAPVQIGLTGTQNGVSYNLYKDGTFSGVVLTGNGSPQSTPVTVAGVYTYQVINTVNSCGNTDMYGSKTVTTASPVTPTVTIEATPSTTVTTGSTITFWAKPTDGGIYPSYQWKKNGVNVGLDYYSYTATGLANNDVFSCVMTSSAACATTTPTSNSLTVTVLNSPCNCTPFCSPIPTTAGDYTASVANNSDGDATHYCDGAGNLLLSIKHSIYRGVSASDVQVKVGATTTSFYPRWCGQTVNANKCFLGSTTGNALINRWWHINKMLGETLTMYNPIEIWSYIKETDYNDLNTTLTTNGQTALTSMTNLKLYQPVNSPALGVFGSPSDVKLQKFYPYAGDSYSSNNTHVILHPVGNTNNIRIVKFNTYNLVNSGGIGKF